MAQIKSVVINWKHELRQLKLEYTEKHHPDFFKMSGGYSMKTKPYRDDTSNGLTAAILDFLKFNGNYSNRINCMGVNRRINGKMVYTPSSTRRGVADIHAIINGKHCSIEVKCKATNDKMSKEQDQERKLVESAGGIYYVAQDMASFISWYNQTFSAAQTTETSINK